MNAFGADCPVAYDGKSYLVEWLSDHHLLLATPSIVNLCSGIRRCLSNGLGLE